MQKELIEKTPILKLTIEFPFSVIVFCELLDAERKFIVGKQLLRLAKRRNPLSYFISFFIF